MASQWFCKILGREMGPVTFRDLADMVRAGTLTEEDPVRRKGAHEWTAAREVIGLFRAAEQEPVEEAPPPEAELRPVSLPPRPTRPPRRRWKLPRLGRRTLITTGCTVMLIVLAATVVRAWMSRRRVQFPQRYREREESSELDVAELSRPEPETSSAPGLDMRRPALIPGLAEVDPAFAPCLTADLCTIVFSAKPDVGTGYDLFLAKRESVSHPFEKPEPIQACASRQSERFATLSPDGLELLFLRAEDPPQLFYSRRKTKLNRFDEPVRLSIPWVENMNQRLERVQFLDASHLALLAKDYDSGKRLASFAVRPDQESGFSPGGAIPFGRRFSAPFFIAASGLRAYYVDRKGISVTARRYPAESFQPKGALILEPELTGPIRGPIWVAPQEDVIFYCSPGPGDPTGSARRLWLIRF